MKNQSKQKKQNKQADSFHYGISITSNEAFFNLLVAYKGILDLPEIAQATGGDHIDKTPLRAVKALSELLSGYRTNPEDMLRTSFVEQNYNQMICVNRVSFSSLCMHHLLTFHGYVYFAYIPDGKIVGLSKIPRLVECLSRRLQVQEKLSEEIVDVFQRVVQPRGCAVAIEARHECMAIRGIKQQTGFMRTVALRGLFQDDRSAKEEFLSSIKDGKGI